MKCKPKKIIIYIILIILTLIYILPFLWMINVSLKTNQELMTNPFSMPEVLQLGNYIYAWVNGNLGIAMLNSFIVCSVSLILSLTIGSMAAFAIARMKWKLSEWTLSYFLFGMMMIYIIIFFGLHFIILYHSDNLNVNIYTAVSLDD